MAKLTPKIVPGDWNAVAHAIAKLDIELNTKATPTFAGVTLSGLTASRLMATDTSKVLASVADLTSWITGTANQVVVADDGDGTITLSLPQNIHTGATPTFADLTLSSPSNIYGLSHDSFANFVATEHLDHALIQDASLVNWWRMDDITGTTVTDLGSAGEDGVLTNTPTQIAGVLGKAYNFARGNNEYIDLPNYAGTDGLTSYSVSCWFKFDQLGAAWHSAIMGFGASTSRMPWIYRKTGTSVLQIDTFDGTNLTRSNWTISAANIWIHLVYVYNDSGRAYIYINGVDVGVDIAVVGSPPASTGGVASIGEMGGGNYLDGDVDDVRVYSRVLTQAEAQEIYELGTLNAMTTFDAAYFKKYIASRSGYFNNLNVSGKITANDITANDITANDITANDITANDITANDITANGLTVTGGLDIDINASNLVGVSNILPEDDGVQNLGSIAKTFQNLYIKSTIIFDDDGRIGVGTGPEVRLIFDSSNSFFEFLGGKVGIETTTPDETLQVVGSAKFGDDNTNYVLIENDGDMVFVGGAGLAFTEINVVSNATETAIASAGAAVQITIFNTNGPSNNITPDHTNDHITITKAGIYLITVSSTVNSVAGAASRLEMTVLKNNGTTLVGALHCDRDVGGGGTESGSVSISGLANLSVNDTIEVWIENETNTQNYVVEDITLTLVQVGGT